MSRCPRASSRSSTAGASFEVMGSIDLEDRVRAICMALPGVTERLSHGAPAFFAGKQFLMLWPDGHHDHQFPHLWCAAPPGDQDELVTTEPERFFRPPYVGGRGWVASRWRRRLGRAEGCLQGSVPHRCPQEVHRGTGLHRGMT